MSAGWMEKVILVLKTIFSTIRRVKAGATLEMKKQSNLTSDHRTAPLNHTFHPLSSYLQLLVSFSLLLFINTIKLNMLSRQSTSKPSPFALSASFNTYLIGSRLSTTHFHRSFHETSALYHTVCPHAWYSNQRLNTAKTMRWRMIKIILATIILCELAVIVSALSSHSSVSERIQMFVFCSGRAVN